MTFTLKTFCVWAALLFLLPLDVAGTAGSADSAQDLKGQVTTEDGKPISGAVCTLTGTVLPREGVAITVGDDGKFSFTGLVAGSYDLVCAAVGYQPVMRNGIEVTDTAAPYVEVVMPAAEVVRQKVEVTSQAPKVAQENTAPPATISSKQLLSLPLVQQKFKAALPLLPGVVRTPDGRLSIKGAIENQGVLLVDSAETVDPVTGSFSIEVPIDAVESVQVFKTAYLPEYGRFSGGLTSVQTKAPLNRWHWELNDFLPTPRIKGGSIRGIADDSPRLMFTGPIWGDKLNFSESFMYELDKQPVRGLAYPHNEIKQQGADSFTNFYYIFSAQHLASLNVKLFPMRKQFENINSFVPQPASTDYGQSGYSIGATDRYMFTSGSTLTTLFQHTDFSSYSHGQGPEDMLIQPDAWDGNFFNAWTRESNQQEFMQTFQFPRTDWHGRHDVKIGGDFIHRSFRGTSLSHPVQVLREDGSLAQLIQFQNPNGLGAEDTELAFFAQDHWAFNDQVAVDYGLRFSGQTIGEHSAFAPRLGLVYSPGKNGKTILRSGFGLFYDRVPLLAGDFTQNPVRTVTTYETNGLPIGPPLVFQNAYEKFDREKGIVVPSKNQLASTPFNLTWNLEADQEIRPDVIARISYLSSRTYDMFVVDPEPLRVGGPTMLLTNTGGSRYHEVESTLRVRPSEYADFNISYVHSLARGDLNTLSSLYVPFEQPVIRPNFIGTLPTNVPHRVITWGRFKMPGEFTASPLLDVHTGFPYSAFDALQNYFGPPNSLRFPSFASLDLQLTKDFKLPLSAWLKKHKFRIEFRIFNITNHGNFRDVHDNIASPFFGQFTGFQHRSFDVSLDIVY